MARGSCLCGDVVFRADGPFAWMSHCHCSRCRKAHGAGFATYVAAPGAGFAFEQGEEGVARFSSAPGITRSFCPRCGSIVPGGVTPAGFAFVPAGSLEGDLGVRPMAHIFVASKAEWYEIPDTLPRFDAFPPGVPAAALPDLAPVDPPGAPRGSCLCGGVAFVVEGPPIRAANCHCTRCRKARGAAHASNFFTELGGVRFTRGEDRLASYHVPGARYFEQVFCTGCGAKMPRLDPERGIAVVPMGALDDDAGLRPQSHIFVGSKASWFEIADALPQHAEGPPAR
jgi:hypothetical protein